MTAAIERIRPEFLWNKPHFTNLVTSEGGQTIHLSGLVATSPDKWIVCPPSLVTRLVKCGLFQRNSGRIRSIAAVMEGSLVTKFGMPERWSPLRLAG